MNGEMVVDSLLHLYAPSAEQQAEHANRLNSLQPPPDVHGDRAFLLKIQYVRPSTDKGALDLAQYVVCDRQRTFEGYLRSNGSPSWSTVVKQIPPLAMNEKLYRWAKRSGDWELSICLDREPGGGTPSW